MNRPINNSNKYNSGDELQDLRDYVNDLNKYIDFLELRDAKSFNQDLSNWDTSNYVNTK